MKTQIIALESHDDLISVRDRMSWAKSPRILLVWPKFEKVTLRSIDLRILQEHARYLGANLGLVTRRGDVRRDALGFGIPVFASTTAAQREVWPAHRPVRRRAPLAHELHLRTIKSQVQVKEAEWQALPLVRIGFFSIGVLAVLAVAALFVPRATIRLSPLSQRQDLTISVAAQPAASSVLISGAVPAIPITMTVTASQSAQVTSQASVPQTKATGLARFKNLTQGDVFIPAGTLVYSIGPTTVRFVTMNDTHLVGTANSLVEVPITAEQAGAVGNLPANSIQAVEGSTGLSASVTNPAPTTNGSDLTTTAPSDNDRSRVREVLLPLLQGLAQKQIQAAIGPQDLVLINTLQMGKILNENYDPPAGAAGSLLTLSMSVEYRAEYVKAADLTQLAKIVLDSSAPAGFVPVAATLSFRAIGSPTSDPSGATDFQLQVEQTLVHLINPAQANVLVRGLPLKAALRVLRSNLPLASAPQIELDPSWWPWLPLIPFRIQVN